MDNPRDCAVPGIACDGMGFASDLVNGSVRNTWTMAHLASLSHHPLAAEPRPIALNWAATALVIIDMQRDFLEPGGFGESLGNDVSRLAQAVQPTAAVLAAARALGLLVIHTREGHLPDLSDAPASKIERGEPSRRIGDVGPMGRILIRGEAGHDIIPALYPVDG